MNIKELDWETKEGAFGLLSSDKTIKLYKIAVSAIGSKVFYAYFRTEFIGSSTDLEHAQGMAQEHFNSLIKSFVLEEGSKDGKGKLISAKKAVRKGK